MQRFRENLTLALIALLPFHAFMVTVGTRLIAGPGQAPLTVLAMWKEGLLVVILGIAAVEIVISLFRYFPPSPPGFGRASVIRLDVIDALIVTLIVLAFAVSYSQSSIINSQFLFGFKYDFIPLIAFLILRRVPWSDMFTDKVLKVLVSVGAIIAGYGIISFFLPQSFFVWLGYSDLHSLYVPDGPLAAYQQIGGSGIRRIQSVMSGPNQLGIWLLIPFSIALVRSRYLSLAIVFGALVLTFSRSAWIAAGVIAIALMWMKLPKAKFWKATGLLFLLGLVNVMFLSILAPQLIFRVASTRDHLIKPLQAISTIAEHPFGLGLGTAGPASNRTSDVCVHLEAGADASWASDRPDLCVFVADEQVQPSDRACECPLLPENWYLQIGVEMGMMGLVLFFLLVLFLIRRLIFNFQLSTFNSCICLMFLGVSTAALFLHAWEDAAVAYTVWILVGIYYSVIKSQ